MGITGLLPFIRKVWQDTDLSQFAGATVAVDIYCWLHKGAFACAEALALNKPTDQYVYYCVKLIKLLHRFNLKPILIFDGRNLPSKSATEEKRRLQRESNRRRAARCLAEGKKSEAREFFERSIDITPAMALRVMEAAHKLDVDCVVSPYESDAQIAFFCQRGGIADLAISEDSDLLPFGCERVLFKLDINSGRGILIERERLLAEGFPINGGLSGDRFRHMCILSGCDYYPEGVSGVGLTTAAKVMSRTRLGDLPSLLSKLRMYLPKNESANLSPDERESLIRAERTFLHQVVFDPQRRCQVPLTPYPRHLSSDDVLFAGKVEKDNKLALQIALGNVDQKTGESVKSFDPKHEAFSSLPVHMLSIWDPRYRPRPASQRTLKSEPSSIDEESLEGQTGRGKVIKVSYNPPKVPGSDVKKKITATNKPQSNVDEKGESMIFSQYFTNSPTADVSSEGDHASKKMKKIDHNDTHNETDSKAADSDCSLSSFPTSPVFHRSHNRFAVSSPTSPSNSNCQSPNQTQTPPRQRFSLDQNFSSVNHSGVTVSTVAKSLRNSPAESDKDTAIECTNIDKCSESDCPSLAEMSSSSETLYNKKRPLSPNNLLINKPSKYSKLNTPISSTKKSPMLTWCRSVPPSAPDFSASKSPCVDKSKSSAVFKKKPNNAESKKKMTIKRPLNGASNGLVGQIMSLWSNPVKEKLVLSTCKSVDTEVIELE